MSKHDYYAILGITRDATEKELKKAYRLKARQYHPDLNPDLEDAEAMFKLTAEAYEVLTDASRRAIYDEFGHGGLEDYRHGVKHTAGAGFETVEDIFAQFNDLFGDVFSFDAAPDVQDKQSAQPRRGDDIRHTVELDFKESIEGARRKITVQRRHQCEGCGGTGAEPGTQPQTCPQCEGKGKVQITQGFFSVSSKCSCCHGQGVLIEEPCIFCDGSGFEEESKEIKLKIPAGIEDGSRLRIKTEGEPGLAGGEPGDLLVSIKVRPSELFERDGANLHYRAPLSFLHAMLGCRLKVPTLEGEELLLDVPAGTQFGATLRLEGKGIPHIKRKKRGDLIVHLLLVTPSASDTRDHQALIEELAQKLGVTTSGDIAALDIDVKTHWDSPDPYATSRDATPPHKKGKKPRKQERGTEASKKKKKKPGMGRTEREEPGSPRPRATPPEKDKKPSQENTMDTLQQMLGINLKDFDTN